MAMFMQRTLACTLLACACGDDDAAATGDDSGSSSGAATPQSDDSVSVTVASADSTEGGETSDGGGETTTTAADSSSTAADTTAADSSAGDESSTTGDLGDGCLAPEIFAAIDQHAHDLVGSSELLAADASAGEVVGFMLAPALPEPPAIAAQFASLFMQCSGPVLYDEYCDGGLCSQIECTGQAMGWINHMWIEPAIDGDPWSFEEVHIHQRWSGGDGFTFDIETTATGPDGADMSLTGAGEMDSTGMSVLETFPALHRAGPTVLEYADDAIGYSGQLTIADVVVAEVDAAGHLVSTGDCPSPE